MQSVLLSVKDGIATIILNEPERLNTFSPAIKEGLLDALSAAQYQEDVKAVVITGDGKSFCAGGDLKSLKSLNRPNEIEANMRYTIDIIKKIYNLNKPVIASVHGYAAGAGVSLALASDLIVAEENAKFKLAFKNIGLMPDLGLHYFLSKAVGPWKAKELIWRGATFTAKEAREMGIVNFIVQDGEGDGKAQELAKELATGPLLSFGKTKEIINRYGHRPLDDILEIENYNQTILRTSEDLQEGIQAFYEKRKPTFAGK